MAPRSATRSIMRCDALPNRANAAKVAALHAVLAAYRAAALLPRFNYSGSSRDQVSRAVSYLEESSDPKRLFRRAVDAIETQTRKDA